MMNYRRLWSRNISAVFFCGSIQLHDPDSFSHMIMIKMDRSQFCRYLDWIYGLGICYKYRKVNYKSDIIREYSRQIKCPLT